MAGLDNKAVARVFREIEVMMRVLGEDERRAMTYGRVARLIETLDRPAVELALAGRLSEVRGIGPRVQAAVAELADRGACTLHEELVARVPPGVPDILRIPGLGPKRVHAVLTGLGVASLDELEAAAHNGRLAELKGFGKKTAERVLEGIAFLRRTRGRLRLDAAWAAAAELAARLGLERWEVAGPARRGLAVVDLVAIVAAGDPAHSPIEGARHENGAWTVEAAGGPALRVRIVPESGFARAWFEETGPKSHVDGVLARPGADASEDEIYRSRGLHVVPPERRHACDGCEPVPRLVERADLLGLVHAHTTWSDGTLDLAGMAAAARERGYAYLALSDHSRSAAYAGGLSIERLREQGEAVKALNRAGAGLRVLHGVEADILPDGSLDYPDEVLAELDFVIASVHSSFGLDEHAMTERIVRAVRHEHVDILAHPTGRLLLRREPYAVDLERVLQAAAESGTAVELNANPWRLDLDADWHARAQELGVGVPIDPDAHAAAGMDDVTWGVLAARHGGLRPEDVPNTRDADGFLEAPGR